jgi:predicted outer membrane protein
MKSRIPLAAIAFAALLLAAPFAVLAQKAQVAAADAKAMKDLAQANLAEIEGGKLAASKAESADVKQFGQHMADDHGKMLDELKKLAEAKGVDLPTEPKASDSAKLKKLEGLSGERFDRAYMSEMVKDHRKDVKETAGIARKAKDAEFKSAVQQAHDTIAEHLQMAQKVAASEKNEKSAGSGASSATSKKQK